MEDEKFNPDDLDDFPGDDQNGKRNNINKDQLGDNDDLFQDSETMTRLQ